MASLRIATHAGDTITVDEGVIARLGSGLRGSLRRRDDADYDRLRSIWNGMIDRRPALIVQCAATTDVVAAVNFAREHGLLVAVRGGGHNIAGSAVCDGGLVIDLSGMRDVHVDADRRRAVVEGGATLADFDAEAQRHALATPLGVNSTTGVAGLTLGGGFGWLSRTHGMTVDNLLSAEVVTASGEELRASESENPELFWALRGGGGNFGVVTRFEYQLHPVGPELSTGLVVFPAEQATQALRAYARFMEDAPDAATVYAILRKAPPLPFLPEAAHGTDVVVFAFCHTHRGEEGERLADRVRAFGSEVLGEHVGVQPYTAWQQTFDPLLAPGARNYWKSHNFTELRDETIDAIVESATTLPDPQCEIFIIAFGGAISRVSPDATAYPHRDTRFVMNVHGRWNSPDADASGIAWARGVFAATQPHASSGVYVNFVSEDETARVNDAYGDNYARLVQLKQRFDPNNLFRLNQNVRPG